MAKRLKLISPSGSEPIFYDWPLQVTNSRDEAAEIADTIRWVSEDFPELKLAVQNIILKGYDASCYDSMSHLCSRYNKAMDSILQLWKGRAPPPKMFKRPSRELLRHIINVCYNHAVKEPEKLNIYEPFSPEVYGETSFDMVSQIIDEVSLGKDETFLDLGSGVGQVVLQAAASTFCKECYGIEKAETPALYAQAMAREFRRWMAWFGKTYSPFRLESGDFLTDEAATRINKAGITFVNNFAFGPLVNHQLKICFQTMKEGARIVSSREFCPLNFKCNSRNLSELGAMMRVSEMKPRSQSASVSWTGKVLSYYLHCVDRRRLEKFFAIMKKKRDGVALDKDELALCTESNASNSTAAPLEMMEENLQDLYLGATTRHQWQVLTTTIEESKNNKHQKHSEKGSANPSKGKKTPKKTKSNLMDNLQRRIRRKYEAQEKQKRRHQVAFDSQMTHASAARQPPVSNGASPVSTARCNASTDKVAAPLSGQLVETELDIYLGQVKRRYLDFISATASNRGYKDQLQWMIKIEQLKNDQLKKDMASANGQIQSLIEDGLEKFTSRINEIGLVVKTPGDLLTQSTALADRHQQLQDQVIDLEAEVYVLEGKYKHLTSQPNPPVSVTSTVAKIEMPMEPTRSRDLTNKLCNAILTSLKKRKNLLDDFESVSRQVAVLQDSPLSVEQQHAPVPVQKKSRSEPHPSQTPRPIALVSPRMYNKDKTGTVSPSIKRGPGRPRKMCSDPLTTNASDNEHSTDQPLASPSAASSTLSPGFSHIDGHQLVAGRDQEYSREETDAFLNATETLLSLNSRLLSPEPAAVSRIATTAALPANQASMISYAPLPSIAAAATVPRVATSFVPIDSTSFSPMKVVQQTATVTSPGVA